MQKMSLFRFYTTGSTREAVEHGCASVSETECHGINCCTAGTHTHTRMNFTIRQECITLLLRQRDMMCHQQSRTRKVYLKQPQFSSVRFDAIQFSIVQTFEFELK